MNAPEKTLLAAKRGICRLCEEPSDLLKSHILPDLAYHEVIETQSHPRMVVVRNSVKGAIVDKSHQTGFRERLLCATCEAQFNRYETYASNNLLNVPMTPPQSVRNLNDLLATVHVSDYCKLKLFLLSLLWRVGVAEHDFFSGVDLGPHTNRLRKMLHAEDPGDPQEYGCQITRLLPEAHIPVDRLVATPRSTKIDGHNGCLIYFRGFVFHYYVSGHGVSTGVRNAFVNEDGRLLILWMRLEMIPPLRDMWRKCVEAHRAQPPERS